MGINMHNLERSNEFFICNKFFPKSKSLIMPFNNPPRNFVICFQP